MQTEKERRAKVSQRAVEKNGNEWQGLGRSLKEKNTLNCTTECHPVKLSFWTRFFPLLSDRIHVLHRRKRKRNGGDSNGSLHGKPLTFELVCGVWVRWLFLIAIPTNIAHLQVCI